jgi:membrane protein
MGEDRGVPRSPYLVVKERLRSVASPLSPIFRRYAALNISLISGGMAYYVILALAPMSVAIGALAGIFIDPNRLSEIWAEMSSRNPAVLKVFDPAVSSLINLAEQSSTGAVTITTITSLVLAIYVSQKVVFGVRNIEDQIFGREHVQQGLVSRGWSALVALVIILVVVGLLLALTAIPPIMRQFGIENLLRSILEMTRWIFPVVFVYLLVWWVLALVSRGVGKVRWRSPGLIIATLWILGSVGIFGLYANLSTTVGAALIVFGAPIAILIWAFLVFMGFFIGSLVQSQKYQKQQTENEIEVSI